MRIRRIAVLIDGGFFVKRLPHVVEPRFRDSAEAVANSARILCKRHVQRLIGEAWSIQDSRWIDHVYRLFYYDASPYGGVSSHPLLESRIDFRQTDAAKFRQDLFKAFRRQRKFALRLGEVIRVSDWQISPKLTTKLLKTRNWLTLLEERLQSQEHPPPDLSENQAAELESLLSAWRSLGEQDVYLGLRQKGVDMRIGLDIASITLKRQADTIVLVTGDSDFVPAAKLARREGVEFILDPMWQNISDDLLEHIDGLFSPLQKSGYVEAEGAEDD